MTTSTFPRCGHYRVPSNTTMIFSKARGKQFATCRVCKRNRDRERSQAKRNYQKQRTKPPPYIPPAWYLAEKEAARQRREAKITERRQGMAAKKAEWQQMREKMGESKWRTFWAPKLA